MKLDRNKIINESEIDDIQKRWKSSKHPINNPRGYKTYQDGSFPDDIILQRKSLRNADFNKLEKIIYDELTRNPEYYQSGKLSNHDAFRKYINKYVKIPFIRSEQLKSAGAEKNTRVHWTNHKKPYPPINNKSTEDDYHKFCELRFNKLLLLAKVCSFIDHIQVDDYRKNEIVIDQKGLLQSRHSLYSLLYGKNHALSAYLGQWIIRLFPFKDYTGFVSEKYVEEEGSGKEVVYEHFTPMSFFRDLIWFKCKSDDKYIFDWENLEHRAYNVEEWLSFLWYRYRTVSILKSEDKILNNKKEKSRRSEGNTAYADAGIKIHSSMSSAWDEVHKIERLEKIIL